MAAVSPDTVLDHLHWRYAVKKFDTNKTIPATTWKKLEEAVILSPSSYGLQPWKFFVVTNPEKRLALRPHAWNQSQITDASHLVVFALKKGMGPTDAERLVKRSAEVRGVPVETLEPYKNMMAGSLSRQTPEQVHDWMSRQVFIALGIFLTTAALLGVDACPMEGFVPEKFDDVLGLEAKGYTSIVLATAGYRAADDHYAKAAKVRFAHEEVIEHI